MNQRAAVIGAAVAIGLVILAGWAIGRAAEKVAKNAAENDPFRP